MDGLLDNFLSTLRELRDILLFRRLIATELLIGLYYRERAGERGALADHAGAVEDYTESLKHSPNHYQAYVDRGEAYLAMGERAKALADFNRAIKRSPDRPGAYLARGLLYRDTGKADSALNDFRKACEMGDETACGYYTDMRKVVK